MHQHDVEQLALKLQRGELSVADFVASLAKVPTIDLGDAQLDMDRQRRCGFPEVVYAEGKSIQALERICEALLADGLDVFATRVNVQQAAALDAKFSGGRYNSLGRTYRIARAPNAPATPTSQSGDENGRVTIITAGTSDRPVAEEAYETALWMGVEVNLIQDVGVAGPHRLPERLPEFIHSDALVVIAGMEGALPSVAGGYVSCPVFAVPTSVGYGASFGGLAALLGMLNSCASNVAVVNIDAGFKGAYLAGLVARNAARKRAK